MTTFYEAVRKKLPDGFSVSFRAFGFSPIGNLGVCFTHERSGSRKAVRIDRPAPGQEASSVDKLFADMPEWFDRVKDRAAKEQT